MKEKLVEFEKVIHNGIMYFSGTIKDKILIDGYSFYLIESTGNKPIIFAIQANTIKSIYKI